MNVTVKDTGELSAVLSVEIKAEDYQSKVEKQINDYRKKASIPGFRPGHVPASLIRKQYGKGILIEEVNHILQHAVEDHLKENQMDILGNPLPVPQTDIDWDTQTEFVFDFELGLAPEFSLTVDNKIKVPYYKITADKEMVERYASDYAKRFGKMSYPESVEEDSIIKAYIVEVEKDENAKENGISLEGTFTMDNITGKKNISALVGSKKDSFVVLDVNKAFNKDFSVSGLLKISDDELAASTGLFRFKIEEISKLEPAEMNQELFDKVFGEGAVDGEKGFLARIKEDAENMFIGESERKFYEDLRGVVLNKTKFDLPDEFLKKWMQTSGEKPISEEEVEKEYPNMKDGLKWQLVENKVVKDHKIEINREELKDFTKAMITRQMAQYGPLPESMDLDSIAENVMENQEEVQRMSEQLFTEKIVKFFKENVKLSEKEVSFDDFIKLATKK
tara:strand:- start:65 stop:1411 length:1347 start_codon:yes stop_codon:yes gene_type:complete